MLGQFPSCASLHPGWEPVVSSWQQKQNNQKPSDRKLALDRFVLHTQAVCRASWWWLGSGQRCEDQLPGAPGLPGEHPQPLTMHAPGFMMAPEVKVAPTWSMLERGQRQWLSSGWRGKRHCCRDGWGKKWGHSVSLCFITYNIWVIFKFMYYWA